MATSSSFRRMLSAVLLCCVTGVAWSGSDGPVVLSPVDGDRIPRPEQDTSCAAGQPCRRFMVSGRVPPGRAPVLVVAPLMAAPRMWVQPEVIATKADGGFDGMVYIGTEREGVGEKFSIFALACGDKKRLREGQILTQLPTDCAASTPVTILRTR